MSKTSSTVTSPTVDTAFTTGVKLLKVGRTGNSERQPSRTLKVMKIVPLTLKQANKLVGEWHRHHKLAVGHRWSIGVEVKGEPVGAAIVGRPVARMTPQYSVAEVSRPVTNGHENACSKLYAAAARAAQAMGFEEIQTFILSTESGVSLKAAGWTEDTQGRQRDQGWNRPSRGGRRNDQPTAAKRRFYKILSIEERQR